MTRSFFDTNVLLYLFDRDEPEKKARAQEVFEGEVEAERATVSTQVLQEFYVNATRTLRRPLPPEIAEVSVERARSSPRAVPRLSRPVTLLLAFDLVPGFLEVLDHLPPVRLVSHL